jgi:hypothetical protein
MFSEGVITKQRKGLIVLGLIAIGGHLVGVAADIYSGYVPSVDVQLGSITSIALENIAPLFITKSLAQARIGHYLAIFFIPLGLAGILQVFLASKPSQNKLAFTFLAMGVLGIVYATFYHGTLAFVIGALQQSSFELGGAYVAGANDFVDYFNSLSEPLGRVLLGADVLVSSLYVLIVLRGSTHFSRWMAAYNPVVIQLVLSSLILIAPQPLNQLIWLTVFNASMVLWYLGLTLVLSRNLQLDD